MGPNDADYREGQGTHSLAMALYINHEKPAHGHRYSEYFQFFFIYFTGKTKSWAKMTFRYRSKVISNGILIDLPQLRFTTISFQI